jgi:ADP-ribose pyrophosphatase YjhB (NUDIX family)
MSEHLHHPHAANADFAFCPKCGADLEPRTLKAGEPPRLVCTACDFVFFLDPKVATGCIVEPAGRIVLLRRAIEPGYGKWVFPGGYVDRGERVEEAAVREMEEECRLRVRLTSLVGVYSYPGRPVVVVVYAGEVVGGQLEAADEALEARTFAPAEIPWAELAFTSTYDALADYTARVHALGPPLDVKPPGPI